MANAVPIVREETPVDDVRRIRERFTREAGGDIAKLIEDANEVAEEYVAKLGLRVVAPPGHPARKGATEKQ
jgi:hypothetical protein